MNKKYLGLSTIGAIAIAFASTTSAILPTGAGNYSAWTPSTGTTHYTLVDETTCNGTTDYVSTTVTGNRDSYSVPLSSIPDGSTITGITIVPCASRNTSKTSIMNVFYRLNGVNSADQGAYSLTGTTPTQLASTSYSGLSVLKSSTTTLESGVVYSSGTGGVRLSNLATVVTYTKNYTINASASPNGTLSPGTSTVAEGSNITYTITPNSGYYISSLIIDGTSTAATSTYTFVNVQASHTINVTFSPVTFSIFSSTGPNGSISPNGTSTVSQGSNKSYVSTPNTGYYLSSLIIDGATTTASTTYYFVNVQASHTISAIFSVLVPNAPTSLVASATGTPSNAIALNWVDNSNNENGFEIERSTDGINFSLIATTTPHIGSFASYVDNTGVSGNSYSYRVRAYVIPGYSSYSNVSSTTMP